MFKMLDSAYCQAQLYENLGCIALNFQGEKLQNRWERKLMMTIYGNW